VEIRVCIHLDSHTVTGNVSLPRGKRLSDLLNGSIVGQSEHNTMFLELTDVIISHADGTEEKNTNILYQQSDYSVANDARRRFG